MYFFPTSSAACVAGLAAGSILAAVAVAALIAVSSMLALWGGAVLYLYLSMKRLIESGRAGSALWRAKALSGIWPFEYSLVPDYAILYLLSGRPDSESIAAMAEGIGVSEKSAELARAVADRTLDCVTKIDEQHALKALTHLWDREIATDRDSLRLAAMLKERGDREGAKNVLDEMRDSGAWKDALRFFRDMVIEEQGRGQEEEGILRESLASEPDHAPAVMALYRILEGRWDTMESSLDVYRKALKIEPGLKWAHNALAEIMKASGKAREAIGHYLRAGLPGEAEGILRRATEAAPGDDSALAALRDFYMERGRSDSDARATYERWIDTHADDVILSRVASVYEEAGYHGPDAIRVFELAAAAGHAGPRARTLLAESYRDAGRARDAVWLLEETREEHRNDQGVLRALCRMYVSNGVSTQAALAECLSCVKSEFDEAVAAFVRDRVLASGDTSDEALEALEIWRTRHPEDLDASLHLGRILSGRGDHERGIPLLTAAAEAAGRPPWLTRALADLFASAGRVDGQAEDAYSRAIAAGVAGEPVLLALASVYARVGRRDLIAAEVYRRASGVAGCPGGVKLELAGFLLEKGAAEDALDLCREILKSDPENESASVLESRALLAAGHVEKAMEGLWLAWRRNPEDPRSVSELTGVLVSSGDARPEAAAVLEKYIEMVRAGKIEANAEKGAGVMRTLGLASFRAGNIDRSLSILKALYSRDASRHAGERLATEMVAAAPAEAMRVGMALLSLGDFSRAHQPLVAAIKVDRSRIPVVVGALAAARAKFPELSGQAMGIAESLSQAAGDDPWLTWEIADSCASRGDMEEAGARLRAALGPGAGPDPAWPSPVLAAARKGWESALSRSPASALSLQIMGRFELMAGNHAAAADLLRKARSMDSRDRHSLHALRRALQSVLNASHSDGVCEELADLFIEEGETDLAIPLLQKIPEQSPRRRSAIAKLARCFMDKGHPLVASRNLERSLGDEDVNGENVEMFYTLACAYEAAQDVRKSKITFERIGFWKYDYKDVRDRLASLSSKVEVSPSTPITPSPLSPAGEQRLTLGALETAELPSGRVEGGRFEILELRGRGGMALVYKALDHEFDPPLMVALKVLPDEFMQREKAVRLLKREASAAIQLNHPGIVRIFSTGEEQGKRYISMEYIEGPDFATMIDKKGPLPAPGVAVYFRQILEALGYAHSMGVIHKDIKPSNIMLTEDTQSGRVKITDFGIARVVTDQIAFSRTLSVRGTLPYMSPQQIAGEQADAQSDIYSLGTSVYEFVTGDPPFTRGDIAYQHKFKEPVPPSQLVAGIPPGLEKVILRCLSKKPVARYRTAAEALDDLSSN